jgi:putative effector of murein hydrolase
MARKQVSENKVVLSSSAAPARHKTVAPKRATRPAAVEVSNALASEPEVLPVAPIAAVVTPAESLHDAVARLAYSYWLARGCQGGSPEEDWLRAERELSAE